MFALSRALSSGLGLGLAQRFLSSVPRTATHSCAQWPVFRIAQAIRQSPIIQAARNLQTSARLQAAKRAPSAAKAAPPRTKPTAVTPPSSPNGSRAMASRLASRGQPTVLYECPSHFWLHVSSVAAATFCIAYATYHYWYGVVHPPPGLAWYVPPMFAVICLFVVCAGFWFLYSTAYIVRKITVIPKMSVPASYLRVGKTLNASEQASMRALQESPIALDCQVSKMVPFLPAKRVIAAPSEVWRPLRFQDTPLAAGAAQKPPRPPKAGGVTGMIVKPFQVFGKGLSGAFQGLRRGLIQDGFVPIKIKGVRYKVDVLGGKLYDQGRAADKLIPLRPEKFKDIRSFMQTMK